VITKNELLGYLTNSLPYQQRLVSIIDEMGRQIYVDDFNHLMSLRGGSNSIKVEGMEKYSKEFFYRCKHYAEKYNHQGPVTCHLFMARAGDPSFPMHTDPDDVIILCCEGKKVMKLKDETVIINSGEELHIPYDTPHQALNECEALTLSFGLERYITEKL
jgi:mannose-6-phosphate isomerase-like protein (cupin superfamily)